MRCVGDPDYFFEVPIYTLHVGWSRCSRTPKHQQMAAYTKLATLLCCAAALAATRVDSSPLPSKFDVEHVNSSGSNATAALHRQLQVSRCSWCRRNGRRDTISTLTHGTRSSFACRVIHDTCDLSDIGDIYKLAEIWGAAGESCMDCSGLGPYGCAACATMSLAAEAFMEFLGCRYASDISCTHSSH
jgi:hypothetical protein